MSLSLPFNCNACYFHKLCGDYTEGGCFCLKGKNEIEDCVNCKYICSDRKDLGDFINAIGGTAEFNVIPEIQEIPSLPPYVPVVTAGFEGKSFRSPYIAISCGEILTHGRKLTVRPKIRSEGVQKFFGVSETSTPILLHFDKDTTLEKIWDVRKENNYYDEIASLNIEITTAFNFSIFYQHPRTEHLINMKRSLLTLKELQDNNFECIPHMYWYNKKDILRWIEWLNQNPYVTHISVCFQTIRNERSFFEKLIEDLKFIKSQVKRELHYVFVGISSYKRIRYLASIFGNLTIINADACLAALKRKRVVLQNEKLKKMHDENLDTFGLFVANVNTYSTIIGAINGTRDGSNK